MNAPQQDNSIPSHRVAIGSTFADTQSRLQDRLKQINDEIGTYPTPIAGCDQQFNDLLEQRTAVAAELRRLREMEASARDDEAARGDLLNGFVGGSAFLGRDAPAIMTPRTQPGGFPTDP